MHRRPWIPPVGLVLSVGVVAALTLYAPAVPGLTRPRFSDCWSGFDVHRLLSEALLTPSGQANVALFVPLGTFLFLVWRRAVTAAAMILGTTLLIELAQGLVIGGHDCSIADLVANTTGGWAGIALTAAGVRAAT